MKKTSLLLFAIILYSINLSDASQQCSSPQIIFYKLKDSFFSQLQDLQTGFNTLFSPEIEPIQSAKHYIPFLVKSEFILKNIVPEVIFDTTNQKIVIGQNQITRTGGLLDLKVNFEYEFTDINRYGLPRVGLGKGVGKFIQKFPISMIKTSQYLPSGNTVKWTVSIPQISIPDLLFLKQQGTDLKQGEEKRILELMNESLGSKFESIKYQLIKRFKGLQDYVANFNNQVAQSLFSHNHPYVFQGKKIYYDYTLMAYKTTREQGEVTQITGDVYGIDNVCYPISTLTLENSHVGISKSLLENTFKFLSTNKMIFSFLDEVNWKLKNFQFTIRDLSSIVPELTNGSFNLTDQVSGYCQYITGSAPAFNRVSGLFDSALKMACYLNAPDNSQILDFEIDANLHLNIVVDDGDSVLFRVDAAEFYGSQYTAAQNYSISQPQLASIYISDAAATMIGTPVYGSELISLDGVSDFNWQISEDDNTIFLYGDDDFTLKMRN